MKTLGEQLISVQRAIDKAETAQSYKIDNREATRANLNTLYKRETELLKKIEVHGSDYIPQLAKAPSRKARIVTNY
jgi:FixJ family two-component response regulator